MLEQEWGGGGDKYFSHQHKEFFYFVRAFRSSVRRRNTRVTRWGYMWSKPSTFGMNKSGPCIKSNRNWKGKAACRSHRCQPLRCLCFGWRIVTLFRCGASGAGRHDDLACDRYPSTPRPLSECERVTSFARRARVRFVLIGFRGLFIVECLFTTSSLVDPPAFCVVPTLVAITRPRRTGE